MSKVALIFDCDGTLMDSLGQALESFHYALEQMDEKPRTDQDIKQHFGVSADRILMRLLDDVARGQEAYEIYKHHQSILAPQTPIHAGIRELLEEVQKKRVPLALVTGRHAHDLEILLRPHGLSDFFKPVVTDDQLSKPKPSPEGLLQAASIMGMAPENILYIGDSISDIEAAKAAGATAVAALWDRHVNQESMLAAQPHYQANHPREVWKAYAAVASRSLRSFSPG